jgi:hypothetical protein
MKLLVFSWKNFQEFSNENDNLNLDCTSFHSLYFHGLKGRDHSSVVLRDAYKNAKYLTETDVLSRLVNSDYLRVI